MLKFTYPIGLGVTALVALPAALSKQSLQAGPQKALENTLAAIDDLLLVSKAIERREPGSIQRLLDATQPPIAAPAKQDEFLAQLRREVGELRLALEQAPPAAVASGDETDAGADSDLARSRGAGPGGQTRPSSGSLPKQPLEPEGYSADALRQGRLLFRANQFSDAIEVLSTLESDPEARYWVARSFEALGNESEAITRYQRLIDDPAADHVARRARHDLSFLEWKQRFQAESTQDNK